MEPSIQNAIDIEGEIWLVHGTRRSTTLIRAHMAGIDGASRHGRRRVHLGRAMPCQVRFDGMRKPTVMTAMPLLHAMDPDAERQLPRGAFLHHARPDGKHVRTVRMHHQRING